MNLLQRLLKSPEHEISEKRIYKLKRNYDHLINPFMVNKLFSSEEKKYIHEQKEELEIEVISLESQADQLRKKLKSEFISRGELFLLKYNAITSVAAKKHGSYMKLIESFDQIKTNICQLHQMISTYETALAIEFERRKSLFEDINQVNQIFDFSDLDNISLHTSTNTHKLSADIYQQISWTENKLKMAQDEIKRFDLQNHNDMNKKNAAIALSYSQKMSNKKNEINSYQILSGLDVKNEQLMKSEKIIQELTRDVDELYKRKTKNYLDFNNSKMKIKYLHKAQMECFVEERKNVKNQIRELKRMINSTANEYEHNCRSLLLLFDEFEAKIEKRQSTEIKKDGKDNVSEQTEIDVFKEEENGNDNTTEEENVIEVFYEDQSGVELLAHLEKDKKELETEIENLRKQYHKLKVVSNQKIDTLFLAIDNLRNREENNQKRIAKELNRVKKLPFPLGKTINNLDSSISTIRKSFTDV